MNELTDLENFRKVLDALGLKRHVIREQTTVEKHDDNTGTIVTTVTMDLNDGEVESLKQIAAVAVQSSEDQEADKSE